MKILKRLNASQLERWLLLMAVLLTFTSLRQLAAQDTPEQLATGLRVLYPGVEIRLANTQRWLPLALNAEMPIGAGDQVRTDETGRILLTFGDQGQLLMLPSSTIEMLAFTRDSSRQEQLALRLNGHAVQQIVPGNTLSGFQLETASLTVTGAAELFGIWAIEGADPVVVVASGEADVTTDAGDFQVSAGHGLRVPGSSAPLVAEIDPPYNAAQLIGRLDGCPGETSTVDKRGVNVRIGPGFDYSIVGSIPRQKQVHVMAVSEFGDWYRIQAYSGFGWMQSILIVNSCENLPVIPGIVVEKNLSVWNVTPEELNLLEPFYGPPGEDLWFYRGI